MARVFVVEAPTLDIRPASVWGEITVLFPSGVDELNPLDSEYYAGAVIAKLEEYGYDKVRDYICIVGSVTLIAVVLPALALRFKTFKALLYNVTKGEYVVRNLGRWRGVYK